MLQIKRVDATKANVAALLAWLQLEILPCDLPSDVSIGAWWVAYFDGNPIGFASVKLSARWTDTGYLCRAGVIQRFTGKGIQKKLIRVRLALAKRLGWAWVISDTYQNPASTNNLITCYWRRKL